MPETLFAQNLKQLTSVRHAFFTRAWGDVCFSEGGMPPHALDARARMAAHLDVEPQRLLFCRQVHSPDVVTVVEPWTPENAPMADAMVTDKPGLALGVLTADCVPVLLASQDGAVIGAAHAGWRGALSGILENTLAAMEKLGARRGEIRAALGPSIAQESYEVGPEFPAPFIAENADNQKFFVPAKRAGHYQFDLKGYVAAKWRGLGAGSAEIISADTCADPKRFYSHRHAILGGKKKNEGRLVSLLAKVV